MLDGPAKRTGAELGAVTFVDHEVLGLFRQHQGEILFLEPLDHLGQLDIDDIAHVGLAQAAEDDDVVHAVEELGPERALHDLL